MQAVVVKIKLPQNFVQLTVENLRTLCFFKILISYLFSNWPYIVSNGLQFYQINEKKI